MDKRLKRCVFINGKEQNRYTHKTRNETLKALGLFKTPPPNPQSRGTVGRGGGGGGGGVRERQ